MSTNPAADPQECSHYWIIESANGPLSRGVCQFCQQVKEFENSMADKKWGETRPRTRSRGGGSNDEVPASTSTSDSDFERRQDDGKDNDL